MNILFCGGGSAGHVVPNLAVMQELSGRHTLSYAGSRGGIEEGLVKSFGVPFYAVDCPKLVRSLTPKNLTLPFRMAKANREALALVREINPHLVFSKGGYASLPYLLAAHRLKIPALTHESDLSPGLVTRLMGRKCRLVLTSFEDTARRFANGKYVGPPLRRELFGGNRAAARKKYGLSGEKPMLLVLGGGSGSRTLNEAVRAHLDALLQEFDVLHLVGNGNTGAEPARGYVPLAFGLRALPCGIGDGVRGARAWKTRSLRAARARLPGRPGGERAIFRAAGPCPCAFGARPCRPPRSALIAQT